MKAARPWVSPRCSHVSPTATRQNPQEKREKREKKNAIQNQRKKLKLSFLQFLLFLALGVKAARQCVSPRSNNQRQK
jgi:hypothetical protein